MENEPVDAAPPVDPSAPVKHTLPSGKVVSIRSHRTMLGADVATVIGAQQGVGQRGVVDMHTALIALLVTEVEPGRAGTAQLLAAPAPDGTPEGEKRFAEAIAAAHAQRADDYRALYVATSPAWRLCYGLDNITDDYEAFADPKAATSPPFEQKPG